MKHVWGLQSKDSGGVSWIFTFPTRRAARNYHKTLSVREEYKVVKLVPVEGEKKQVEVKKDSSIDISKLAKISEDKGVLLVDGERESIEPRVFHELKGNALWLDSSYDWKIVKDSDNELCLVAIRKEYV